MTDITMDSRYATMFGYTQEEFESNLELEIDRITKSLNIDRISLLNKIKLWYNGYRFHQNSESVYNPVSLAKNFESGGEFDNFWFETGTPTFLIKLMKQNNYDLSSIEKLEMDKIGFSAYEIDNLAIEPLLFQTGYITIKDYDPELALYSLSYPNREVKNAFIRFLMDDFTPVRKELAASHIAKLYRAFKNNNTDKEIILIGAAFDQQTRNIGEWLTEPLKS
ncbi:MAG: AAA family ATPase [Victivallaceae bacterium]|nr:AAA family ATPase [Victivallaceae bacterium]